MYRALSRADLVRDNAAAEAGAQPWGAGLSAGEERPRRNVLPAKLPRVMPKEVELARLGEQVADTG
jgi:hypothetical protein